MDARVQKLVKLGLDELDAEALVESGYDLPVKIRGTSESNLNKAKIKDTGKNVKNKLKRGE